MMGRVEVSVWRDCEQGKVGLEMHGKRRLLDPEEARNHADALEEGSPMITRNDDELQAFLNDLRAYADEIDDTLC